MSCHSDEQPGHTVQHGHHTAAKGEGKDSRSASPVVKDEVEL